MSSYEGREEVGTGAQMNVDALLGCRHKLCKTDEEYLPPLPFFDSTDFKTSAALISLVHPAFIVHPYEDDEACHPHQRHDCPNCYPVWFSDQSTERAV